MKLLTLTRCISSDKGTFGALCDGDKPLCVTCELPWKDNRTGESCVPIGTYETVRFQSPSKGDVFLLKDVPDREMIEIHMGNTIRDIEGCILPGMSFGILNGLPSVMQSGPALSMLKIRYPNGFDLEIRNGF
jgi:hypothetical protein